MTKIKVAFLISNLGQGGAERQLVELIKGINKNVFEIYLFLYAYQKETFYKEIFKINNINIVTKRLKCKTYILKITEALRYIRFVTKNNDFDILFTTLFMNNLFVRIVAPSRYNNKIISNSRNSILLYTNYHLLVEKLLIRRSFFVFNSNEALIDFKNVFSKKYHYKLRNIYNGFNTDYPFKKGSMKSDKFIVIGGLGRQDKQKNFVQLVRVFKLLLKTELIEKNIHLILQGNKGVETEEINNLIGSDTKYFTLVKPNPDITQFFQEINIMVLPSHFEGCPNVLFESMIHKRICIISKSANSDDFVIDGVNGFVYDGSDEGLLKSLKNTISLLGTEKEKQITENAFQYVKENFSMNAMVKKYENLFLEIYEKNKSSN